ncbi:MAG: murein biosynthesis integral membrane protein MurJ [Peptococcaceae bacterium]|nr:murein biosynthesis integral membrane protein MurJ [Peptococcaceae bacterium]
MTDSGRTAVQAAGILMVSTIVSRILGYVRNIVIYSSFGLGGLTDAYNAAFSIPDFLYILLVGGALSSAFIPVFTGYIATDREEEGWNTASSVINILTLLVLFFILLGEIWTPQLIRLLAPGFTEEVKALTVTLTRVMFIQCFFMAMTGFSMGILHSYRRFLPVAVSSVIYNVMIIAVGVALSPLIGIMGYTLGVVAGAAVQFAIQFYHLRKLGLRYRPHIDLRLPGVKRVFILLTPILVGMSVSQLNLFVNQNLASSLSQGTLTALLIAQRLMQTPNGIFATAIAVTMFPTMTAQAARGEMSDFKQSFSLGFRTILFVTAPAAVGMAVLRTPIIRILYQHGLFSGGDTEAAAEALLFYCVGLCAYGCIQMFSRMFYSMQDTWTPVSVGMVSIAVNIALSLLLMKPMRHAGLALAYSLAGIVNMLILFALLRRKAGPMGGRRILRSFVKILLISFGMGLAAWAVYSLTEARMDMELMTNQLIQAAASIGLGGAVFFALARALKMEEYRVVADTLLKRLRRGKK